MLPCGHILPGFLVAQEEEELTRTETDGLPPFVDGRGETDQTPMTGSSGPLLVVTIFDFLI